MKTILVIDDNLALRENTAEILELEQYNVLLASNGRAGVTIATEKIPDLILCDVMMPVLDGFGVFLELNKSLYTAGIPFIFLTAKADMMSKQRGIDLGADDYITKPFNIQLLLTTIETRIRKHDLIKEKIRQERLTYIRELEDMLEMTSHSVRKPICSFLGIMKLVDCNVNITKKEILALLEKAKSCAFELDAFTRELTTFMHEAKENKNTKPL